MSTTFRIAIPARYGSSRLPGKPLMQLAGKPMLEHVWLRACESGADEVVVATDDDRIAEAAAGFGAEVCMTRADHASGTDRLAEVATTRGWSDDAIIVNLQGDEPLTPPGALARVASDLAAWTDASIATLATPISDPALVADPNVVKVVVDEAGFALYFSRAPIPYRRPGSGAHDPPDRRHIGIYAYRGGFLRRYGELSPSPLERAEQLEQLRAMANGYRIHVSDTEWSPAGGVDVAEDLARVEAALVAFAEPRSSR
jgi:3-deoxy-manno-octulosonate cytidylyltransferase (CMP-KDO synthetase)